MGLVWPSRAVPGGPNTGPAQTWTAHLDEVMALVPQDVRLCQEASWASNYPLAEMGPLGTQDMPPGPGLPCGTASGSVLEAPPCGSTCNQRGGHCTAENGQDGPRSLPP